MTYIELCTCAERSAAETVGRSDGRRVGEASCV